MAGNYLGLNKSYLFYHTLPLVQSWGEKNEGPNSRSKYFALRAVSNVIRNYEENTS